MQANHHQRAQSFERLLRASLSRRRLLQGSLAMAVSSFLPGGVTRGQAGEPLSTFRPVPLDAGKGPLPTVSADYDYQVLIPWGTSLSPEVADFEGRGSHRPSAEQQARQVGIGHDGMTFFPFRGSSEHGLLVLNHEYGLNRHILGKPRPETLEELRRCQHAHGVSVVEIHQRDGSWQVVRDSAWNRRIHARSPVVFSGPAAGDALLAPEAPARGTLNNCANGQTPWETYLSCEENFDDYFGATGEWTPSPAQRRYGLRARGQGYDWHPLDPRYDLSAEEFPREENRFGWVVEIDPFDPDSTPVKRTALGRFKHEGAAVVEGDGGRLVVYMGDDERFDYIYRFVSRDDWRTMREAGISPLDEGLLSVARFDEDGSGEWLPLTLDNPRLAGRFASLADILVHTRLAADAAGATPMDRPEWTAVAPDGAVYCTLTKNREREQPGAANPVAPNPYGHILRWRDSGNHTGSRFDWEIFLLAEDTHDTDTGGLGCPDGLWVDPDNRVFIMTDGEQPGGINNQLLVATAAPGEAPVPRRLLTGVTGCEVTGITVTPDRRSLFVNIQHPGNGDPSATSFPAARESGLIPRDCTLVLRRRDGGIVGS